MRLAKYLANAGVASRRSAEQMIAAGRVRLDGEVVLDPARDVDAGREVQVDGVRVQLSAERVVYALHKPAGVLSTARDTHGRPTVVALVGAAERLYPVGRLDADSTGLILLTNDGDLAYRLTHPSFEVDKTYLAVLGGGPVRERALARLREGVMLEDGLTAPAGVRRLNDGTLAITIHEGRKRQVRRMCAEVGHPVVSLARVRFGPLELGDLALGAHRRLGPEEVSRLAQAAAAGPGRGGSGSPGRPPPRSGSPSRGRRRSSSGR